MRKWIVVVGFIASCVGGCSKSGEAVPSVCSDVTCSGRGVCVARRAGDEAVAVCECDDGFSEAGLRCVRNDSCEGIDCGGSGSCALVEGLAVCECSDGYFAEGLKCSAVSSEPGVDRLVLGSDDCLAGLPPVNGPNGDLVLKRAFEKVELNAPLVGLYQAPGDNSTFYAIEQRRGIVSFENADDVNESRTLIDLGDRLPGAPEAGVLGLAFHPSFPATPYVYVSYNVKNSVEDLGGALSSRISRFSLSSDGIFDESSEEVLLKVRQPYGNHNGGHIDFGPDGFLYIGLGDGGDAGDPEGHGQNVNDLLGTILRIDVDQGGGGDYGIPTDNPFASSAPCGPVDRLGGRESCGEVYAWGLRNPWKFSFDTDSSDAWIGDVGQGSQEEVDVLVKGGNYGWKCREGTREFSDDEPCDDPPSFVEPVHTYGRDQGKSITGGYVYRGDWFPELRGKYIYGDFETGRIWAVSGSGGNEELLNTSQQITSFGLDQAGEIYVVDVSGLIFRLEPEFLDALAGGPSDRLSETGCMSDDDVTKPADVLIPYSPQAPFWSDGVNKDRYVRLPDGGSIQVGEDGDWDLPNGTVLVKSFRFGSKFIETRLYMRHTNGEWRGYSYEWNVAQNEAVLVSGSKQVLLSNQSWLYPSGDECSQCHTAEAGYSLGLENGQLDFPFRYPNGRLSNQLDTFFALDVVQGDKADGVRLVAPTDPTSSLEERSLSYLHTNCSNCHRDGGTGRSEFDLRASVPFPDKNLCGLDPTHGNLGIDGAKVFSPGEAESSTLYLRMSQREEPEAMMPPIASFSVDSSGEALLRSWIEGVSVCP